MLQHLRDSKLMPWLLALVMGCSSSPPPMDSDLSGDTAATGASSLRTLPPPAPSACPPTQGTHFEDMSRCVGVMVPHIPLVPNPTKWYVTGQAVADVDGDEWLDLLLTSQDGSNHLFMGQPDGTFIERTDPALQAWEGGSATFGDVDNDGDPDLFITSKSQDDGLFLNHDGAYALPAPGAPTSPGMGHGAAFSDFDGDGQLELYVTNWHCPECVPSATTEFERSLDTLFVQTATGWQDQTREIFDRFDVSGMGFTATWTDWDNDGDPDLYLANDKGNTLPEDPSWLMARNVYFRNDGPGCRGTCFEEVALSNGSDFRVDGMGQSSGDIDNDGDFDLAVSNGGPAVLAINDGTATFVNEASARGVGQQFVGWGTTFLDYDNDGWLDLFIAGNNDDRLWNNNGDGHFRPVARESGVADSRVTYGAIAADYDRDGRVDLIVGDYGGTYRVLRNTTTTANHWLGLRLIGRGAGGRDALGARVWVTDDTGRRQMREVKSGSSLGGGEDLGLHFGLGRATPTRVELRWPDGTVNQITPAIDAWTVVSR